MSGRIKVQRDLQFITFATVGRIDALTRPEYKKILIDSLELFKKERGLILYAYVIMPSHVYLIVSAKEEGDILEIIKDFKRHSSRELLKKIAKNSLESRKQWMLWLMGTEGRKRGNKKAFQFWQADDRPIQLSTDETTGALLKYLHDIPVVEELVAKPEHYLYSSAANYAGDNGLIKVDFLI
jgi:REP element-mobilizing transposase RayT